MDINTKPQIWQSCALSPGKQYGGVLPEGLTSMREQSNVPKREEGTKQGQLSSQIDQSNKPSHLSRAELVKGHREATSYIL